jgi:cytochrome c oxidase subunit 3
MATGFHGFTYWWGRSSWPFACTASTSATSQPRQHFGFEAAAWYWHFVDVVWLFLFIAIYIWGSAGVPVH